MNKKFKRRYLVDGRYQIPQLVAVIAANVLAVLLAAALLSWFYLLVWDGSIAYNHNRRVPIYVAVCILIVIAASCYFSMRRSRETAGLMKKLHLVLDDAGKGLFPDQALTFRKSDYFKELAVPLNTCLLQLKEYQERDDNDIAAKLQQLIEDVEGGVVSNREIVQTLQSISSGLK